MYFWIFSFIIVFILPSIVRYYFSRGKEINLDETNLSDNNIKYELSDLKAPVLSGLPLLLFAWATETPVLAAIFLPKLLHDSGFTRLRRVKTSLPPTTRPPGPLLLTGNQTPVKVVPFDVSARSQLLAQLFPSLQQQQKQQDQSSPVSCLDFHRLYKSGKLTPTHVAMRLITLASDEAVREGPVKLVNCVRKIDKQDLLVQAAQSTERYRAGNPVSLVDGVPVFFKDEGDVRGFSTTLGTVQPEFCDHVQQADSECVARLRSLGALIAGKAVMHEIGIAPLSKNPHYAPVRNPHDPTKDAGGSSSGSAACVALGLCPFALGADGGGSVRVPAAYCGVWGLKPTFDRLSGRQRTPALAHTVGSLGFICRTAADLVVSYACVAGPPSSDLVKSDEQQQQQQRQEQNQEEQLSSASQVLPAPSYVPWQPDVLSELDQLAPAPLNGLRVGVFWTHFNDCDEQVRGPARRLLDKLVAKGVQLVELEIPFLEEMRVAHTCTIVSEMSSQMNRAYVDNKSLFGVDTRVSLAAGRAFTAVDYLAAAKVKSKGIQIYQQLFDRCDVLITPCTGVGPPDLLLDGFEGGHSDIATIGRVMRYSFVANLLGLPALTVPTGWGTGTMFTGRWWNERQLLQLALALEQQNLVSVDKPKLHVDY